ncbi:MAG: pyroglutamyl-peptidase I [Clostridia bacterium]|nr:pyroglutamyl-peptidase I [Clostridia bacterium]
MNKKILLTCFEPFGGESINPSYEAVMNLSSPDGMELIKTVLPVEWGTSAEKLISIWEKTSPDAVIMTGLAGGADKIRIERVGINLCGAVKDNRGKYPSGEESPCETPIDRAMPVAFFSTFDYASILRGLRAENIPATYSFSAGTYICNYVLFSALAKNHKDKGRIPIGFIHVPYSEAQGKAVFMKQADITRAVGTAIINAFTGD